MQTIHSVLANLTYETRGKSFSDTLRHARDRLGMMQYRAADFTGININRFKNLETAYFRSVPTDEELKKLADFYGMNYDDLREKAERQIKDFEERRKKIRRMNDF